MCRIPSSPCFWLALPGNSTPTISHKFSKHKGSVFPFGCADSTTSDGRRGSNVSEVNMWLWNYGRGKFCLGGLKFSLNVDETLMRKKTVREDQATETHRRRRADGA